MTDAHISMIAPDDFVLINNDLVERISVEVVSVFDKFKIGHGVEHIVFQPIIFDENLRKGHVPNECRRERAFQALFYQENISHEAWMATDDAGRRAMLLDAFATAVSRTPRKFMDEAMRDEICRRVRALI